MKYIKYVYNIMLNDKEIRPVRSLLQTLEFNGVWLFQGVGNINIFLSLFIQRIKDIFVQNWNDRLSNSSRARAFSLFSNFSSLPENWYQLFAYFFLILLFAFVLCMHVPAFMKHLLTLLLLCKYIVCILCTHVPYGLLYNKHIFLERSEVKLSVIV